MAQVFVSDTYPQKYYDAAKSLSNNDKLKTKTKAWLSKPRDSSSGTTEILSFEFNERSAISFMSFDILNVGARYEFWYYDSDNNKLPLLRDDYNQIAFTTKSKEDATSWQHWSFTCIQCIAVKLEIRMTRVADELAPAGDYSLGIRNLAIRRQIVSRADAALNLQDSVDSLGNTISKAVKDWQPSMAIDGDDNTFWKSEPQVSQDAVVSLYLDVRDKYKNQQYIDSLDINPVYTGVQMNIYYSNDDTIGERLPTFDVYDFVLSNLDYDSGNGYSFTSSNSPSMSFNLDKAIVNEADSWMMAMSWWPTRISSSETSIAQIGKSWFVDATSNFTALKMYMYDEMSASFISTSVTLPVAVKYRRSGNDSDIDTEVRLDFGKDASDDNYVYIRCRVINTYRMTGEVESDKTAEKKIRTGIQISSISNKVDSDTAIPANSTGYVYVKNSELEVSNKSSSFIPLFDIVSNDSEANGNNNAIVVKDTDHFDDDSLKKIKITAEVTYRTDQAYTGNALLVLPTNSTEYEYADKLNWWSGKADNSISNMTIGSERILQNYFANPNFSTSGGWQPDSVTGQASVSMGSGKLTINGAGRARSYQKPAFSLRQNTYYVFSAIPTFPEGMSWYKDFKLFVYDSVKEQFIAAPTIAVESGKRAEIYFYTQDDTSMISFGFVGGKSSSDVVTWTKPVVCSIDDWRYMQNNSIDFFSGNSQYDSGDKAHEYKITEFPRYCEDLNINPKNDPAIPLIAESADPSWCHSKPFASQLVMFSLGDNEYDVDNWISIKGGSSFTFSFYMISKNGTSKPQPYIKDKSGNKFYPDRYHVTDVDYGWHLVYARVTIPSGHDIELARFGITESMATAYTCIGDMHVYDNSNTFYSTEKYSKVMVAKTEPQWLTVDQLKNVKVEIRNLSDTGHIFVEKASVKVESAEISDMTSSDVVVGTRSASAYQYPSANGILSNLVFKQSGLVDISKDKFLNNPVRYLSPDSYDESSTLMNALVYGKFDEEQVLRGGVSDSCYMAKTWTPLMTGLKLEKQIYQLNRSVSVKYLKLEFTQLSPVQYRIESSDINLTYQAFPTDVKYDMMAKAASIVAQTKQGLATNSNTISNKAAQYSDTSSLYDSPDTEVSNVSMSNRYIPDNIADSVYDSVQQETTSSATYNGNTASASNADVASYMIYEAQASETLLSIANKYGIADWTSLIATNQYIDDTAATVSVSGKIPGYWVLAGQQVKIPTNMINQISGDANSTVVRKLAATNAQAVVTNASSSSPSVSVIGPECFSKTCVHYYETRTGKRTNSIAYFVGIKDIKVQVIDYLNEHDNIAYDLYSMAMPIWHLHNAVLTDSEIAVPDFSTGATSASANTDVMRSQSYFRTIKVFAANRGTLTNRTYFTFDAEAYHKASYWDSHEEMNVVWDDSSENDSSVLEDNGGAWDSNRYSWGDSWIGTTSNAVERKIWYDGELVKHITATSDDRKFNSDGTQVPYIYSLGDVYISSNSLTAMGVSLFSLKKANPKSGKKLQTTLRLVSGRYSTEYKIDEDIGFDSNQTLYWQNFATSRQMLYDMQYKCKAYLIFNNYEQLDLYMKSAYIETGSMQVLARNEESVDYEDVTAAVGRENSIYTFRNTGNQLQMKVIMNDPDDWFASMLVIPIYIPYEDAVNYASDTVYTVELVQSDGSAFPVSARPGAQFTLSAIITYANGIVTDPTDHNVTYAVNDNSIATVDTHDNGDHVLRLIAHGIVVVTATFDGVKSKDVQIAVDE